MTFRYLADTSFCSKRTFRAASSSTTSVGTLVERQTRMLVLLHLRGRDGESLRAALKARLGQPPPGLVRSITWDQGTEMARHVDITKSLGTPVYFCDSHSPWQRGSNENANGLLRDYLPKGTDLSVHSPEHLLAVEKELNQRPRKVLGDSGSPFRGPDSLSRSVRVATLIRTRQSVIGLDFNER